eukprot:238415_1
MSSPNLESCKYFYLEPFAYTLSAICFIIALYIMYISVSQHFSANTNDHLCGKGLLLNNTSCIILIILFIVSRLIYCRSYFAYHISLILSSLKTIFYIIQLLTQLTIFLTRFYYVFDNTRYKISHTQKNILNISVVFLIIILLSSYIILLIYFIDPTRSMSRIIMHIGVTIYSMGLIFYSCISFILLNMFISRLISLSVSISNVQISLSFTNTSNNEMTNTRTSNATSGEQEHENDEIEINNTLKIQHITADPSIDTDVENNITEKNTNIMQVNSTSEIQTQAQDKRTELELQKIVRLASRLMILTVFGLCTTFMVSIGIIILSRFASAYVGNTFVNLLQMIDAVINSICILLTFDFAECYFQKCIVCSYCSVCCNYIFIAKRAKRLVK